MQYLPSASLKFRVQRLIGILSLSVLVAACGGGGGGGDDDDAGPTPQPAFGEEDLDGNVSFETASPIGDGDTVTQSIGSTRDADYFAFTAGESATYSLNLQFSSPNVYLYWYNSNENRTLLGESRNAGANSQFIDSKLLEAGKLYYIGVQALDNLGAQDYTLSVERDGPAPPSQYPAGTALYSYELDSNGRLVGAQPLSGARLLRRTAYFSVSGDYRQVSFWCCKVIGGEEDHAPRADDFSAPFVYEVDLTELPNDRGMQRELYTDLFLPDGSLDAGNSARWTLEGAPEPNKFSLSGEVRVSGGIVTDSDVNDPTAPFAVNDRFSEAQQLPSLVTVNGFVSRTGTGRADDRYGDVADRFDSYRVSLQAGQQIRLQVADFDPQNASAQDVDLWLYDGSFRLISGSNASGEFEVVNVDEAVEGYVRVEAFRGVSKYVLDIGERFDSGAASGGRSLDFVPNQVIVSYHEPGRHLPTSGVSTSAMLSVQHGILSGATGGMELLQLGSSGQMEQLQQQLDPDHSAAFAGVTATSPAAADPAPDQKYLTMQLAKSLQSQPDVANAGLNYIHASQLEPNDPYYHRQWHYPHINLHSAWDVVEGGSYGNRPIVAVVDTGVLLQHPDLAGQLVPGFDFISTPRDALDGDGIDSNPDDPGDRSGPSEQGSYHGTHVAGTIAARSNNDMGVAGVAWDARIMPVRVLGLGGFGTTYDIMQGIMYAAGLPNDSGEVPQRRADIINMSLGCQGCYWDPFQQLVNRVRAAGVIMIAAAGNHGSESPGYPAGYAGVVSVSALGSDSALAYYSNYGASIDVAAPGGEYFDKDGINGPDFVYSTVGDDSSGTVEYRYEGYQGTSMAAPHVAGVAAMMKRIHPGMPPWQFDQVLADGSAVVDLGPTGRDDIYGNGMIDGYKAVTVAQALSGEPVTGLVYTQPNVLGFANRVTVQTLNLSAEGDSPPAVTSVQGDAEWLGVEPTGNVNLAGLGDYRVSVNRAGLDGSVHRGQIDVLLSDGERLVVPVNVQVLRPPAGPGNPGKFTVLLRDAETLAVFYSTDVSRDGNGRFPYRFTDEVDEGSYRIYAGSDIDNDGDICGIGETCGAWPTPASVEEITVDRDLTDFDFDLQIDLDLGQ